MPGSGLTPEGNAHQGEFSFDNQFLLAADEDFTPFRGVVRADHRADHRPHGCGNRARGHGEADRVPARRDDERAVGVRGRRAASSATIPLAPADDADPNTEDVARRSSGGDVRLRGQGSTTSRPPAGTPRSCSTSRVPTTAQREHARRSARTHPEACTCAASTRSAPPALLSTIRRRTPAAGTAGPAISVGQEFDGWGYAHLYDAKTSEELDSFAIPEALDERFASGFGDLSIHEFATDPTEPLAYSSYYAGGIRVFSFSRAAGLEQTGAWIAPGGSNFWGVEQFTDGSGERLIAGSDRDFGLVILRYTGPGRRSGRACANSAVTTGPGQAGRR